MTNIRRANPDEAANLTSIALESKRYWGYPESWIKHWESDLTITPEFVSNNDVYVAEQEGEVCGFFALSHENESTELDHLWVRPAQIGTGIGKALFLEAMKLAGERRIEEVVITADPNAEGFYRHLGAQRTGEVSSEVEGNPRSLPRMKIKP